MSIVDRLIKRITRGKSIIWGLRVPKGVKERWFKMAGLMGIPTNRLVLFVLKDWAQQNSEQLIDDAARNKLADRIADMYLKNGFL
jgi:hypothetical protein